MLMGLQYVEKDFSSLFELQEYKAVTRINKNKDVHILLVKQNLRNLKLFLIGIFGFTKI